MPDAVPQATQPSGLAAQLNAARRTQAAQVALVLALALALRLAWALITQWHPMYYDDAYFYDFTARALANGRGYIQPTGDPTANWPPGYSVVLATAYLLFGEKVIVAQILNVALGTATVLLSYLIGRRLLGHGPALLGAGIVACFPSLILYTGVTLSEITFTFLALLGIYLLIVEAQSDRPRDLRLLLGAGLALGLAALTRGEALLLPLVFVPFWFRSGIAWRPVAHKLAALALGMGVVIVPWTVRNVVQLHAPVLISTNAGVTFWDGHHESATGKYDSAVEFGLSLEVELSHPELDGTAREVRVSNQGYRKGLKFAATHPTQELILPFKKFYWLYYSDVAGVRWNEGRGLQNFLPGPIREGLLALSDVYYFALAALVVIGVRRWFSVRDPGRLLLISIVAYWTFIHLVFLGDPRFHAPIMPIVALLAGLAWADTIRRRRERPA